MRRFFLLAYIVAIPFIASGQQTIGFTLPEAEKKVSLDFELFNNLIVIPVTINKFLVVKFIVDTGSEAIILTEKAFGDMVGLQYVRSLNITGPGIIDSVEAFVATNVTLNLPGGVRGQQMSMLVLKEDYLQLKENLGDEIYGIIGYDLFSRFVVEVNYDSRKLILHDPKTYKPKKKKFSKIIMDDTKPFIQASVQQGDREQAVKLLVDTGASHPLLLDVHNTDDLRVPSLTIEARLGQGIGGEIPGVIGRMGRCNFGVFKFDNVIVSIPERGVYSEAIKRGSRHGTLGGELLRRFNPVFDYRNKKLYLRKSKAHKDPFEFDMSGLTLGTTKSSQDTMVVRLVEPGTPAFEAGVKEGDKVLYVNGEDLTTSKLSEINGILRKKPGSRIRLVLWKDEEYVTRRFRLRRRI